MTTAENKQGKIRWFYVASIFAAHVISGFILYRGRVVSHWRISDNDLVVFALPAVGALLGNYIVLKQLTRFGRLFASLLLATVSCWCFGLVAFNTYGT